MKYAVLLLLFVNILNAEINTIKEIKVINTNFEEKAPFLSSDESLLFFSSNKNGNFDHYFVNYNDGAILSSPNPINSSDLFYGIKTNSSKNDHSGFLSLENKYFYFASDRNGGSGGSDIYFSKQVFNEWKDLKNINEPINTKHDEHDPILSPDGRTLYFVSNRPGGFGGDDIWFSTYDEFSENWSQPENFEEINTDGNESTPFLASDGKTLFFASDNMMHNMGGKDLYYITFKNDEWQDIQHLPAPINSKGDENNIVFSRDGTKCLISSDRNGDYDLYIADMDPIFSSPIELILKAYEQETGEQTIVSFVGNVDGKKVFTKKGENAQVLLDEETFKGKKYVDIEVTANNPIFAERTKNLRIYNNQKESQVHVLFVLNESGDEIKISELNIPYIEGDFKIKSGNDELNKIIAYETTSSTIKPILNYIFFDENSMSIPRRYNQTKYIEGNEFNEDLLAGMNNMDIYYNILNIIGFRMQEDPSIEITLTGHNSNNGKEKNNLQLSENRAKTISQYLKDVWQISPDRINIEKGNLPEFASSGKTPEGNAENRRVEISSNSDKLLRPVFNNWKTYKTEPKDATINISTLINKTNAQWTFKISHENKIIETHSGNNNGKSEFFWNISESLTKLIKKKEAISEQKPKKTVLKKEKKDNKKKKEEKGFFSKAFGSISDFMDDNLKVYDAEQDELDKELQDSKIDEKDRIIDLNAEYVLSDESGQKVVRNKTIRFERLSLKNVTDPIRLDKYAFISFDFGKTEPTDKHIEILELVNNIIKPNSTVNVYGYTDNIGSEKINQSISEKRANGIAEEINSENIEVKAFGESILLYDNTLPEGRMYSRTIIAEIQTPFNLGE